MKSTIRPPFQDRGWCGAHYFPLRCTTVRAHWTGCTTQRALLTSRAPMCIDNVWVKVRREPTVQINKETRSHFLAIARLMSSVSPGCTKRRVRDSRM